MIVLGSGRVGGALAARARARDIEVAVIDRTTGWELLDGAPGTPILVCTRNDDLAPVVQRVPDHRRGDLVFIQNGMIRPFLADARLGEVTRGLLFFAVPTRGAPVEPGGKSPFTGPHARTLVHWLHQLELPSHEVDWARFSAYELEKLLWNCVFGLLCEVHRKPVGALVDDPDHRRDIELLTDALRVVGRASLGVDLPNEWLVDRLCAYSASIPDYRGAVKEWAWRNGWFQAEARRLGVDHALHDHLLEAAGRDPESGELTAPRS